MDARRVDRVTIEMSGHEALVLHTFLELELEDDEPRPMNQTGVIKNLAETLSEVV
jgi:hypothetical protein